MWLISLRDESPPVDGTPGLDFSTKLLFTILKCYLREINKNEIKGNYKMLNENLFVDIIMTVHTSVSLLSMTLFTPKCYPTNSCRKEMAFISSQTHLIVAFAIIKSTIAIKCAT